MAHRRGYDPEQVRDYLLMIGRQVETLEHELREARLQAGGSPEVVTVPEPREDPYDRLAMRVADVLRSCDEQADRILEDAREEAALTLSEARSEADRIRVDAQSRAEEARQAGTEVLLNVGPDELEDEAGEAEAILDESLFDGGANGEGTTEAADESGLIDPRYEDLWVSSDTVALDLGDLTLDIEDEAAEE